MRLRMAALVLILGGLSIGALILAGRGTVDGDTSVAATTFTGRTMGTSYTVELGEDLSIFQRETVHERVQSLLEVLDQKLSTYREDSDVSRFNRYAGSDWVAVDEETAAVVERALSVSEKTSGAFDITVFPSIKLWGFGPVQQRANLPSLKMVAEVMRQVGYRNLEVRREPSGLRKKLPEVEIDLSAIAKGYAADRVYELLAEMGFAHALVSVGGEIRAGSLASREGLAWKVAVESPNQTVSRVLRLYAGALSTSGIYRNTHSLEGVAISHLIDPTTGWPIDTTLMAVCVISDHAWHSDALSTGIMGMGAARGFAFAKEENIAAIFYMNGVGGVTEIETSAFKETAKTVQRGVRW